MTKLTQSIHDLAAAGKSYREITQTLGCSKGTVAYHLGVGQKDKTRTRKRERRNQVVKLIQEVKSNRPCADCKETYPYWMMEFDHLRDKSFTISQFRTRTQDIDLVKAEMAKCDVVCANCHRNRTFKRRTRSLADVGVEYCTHFGESDS